MRQYRKQEAYAPDLIVNVSVPYIQLKENGLLKCLKARQRDHIPARGITLELTESCWVPNLHSLNEKFKELHQAGYGVAIDDFKTRYSSLSHLKEFPANVLKTDRSSITEISKGSHGYISPEYIIKLAYSISLEVCVEGVEILEELEVMKQTVPDLIQGYLLGRPASASEFETRYLL